MVPHPRYPPEPSSRISYDPSPALAAPTAGSVGSLFGLYPYSSISFLLTSSASFRCFRFRQKNRPPAIIKATAAIGTTTATAIVPALVRPPPPLLELPELDIKAAELVVELDDEDLGVDPPPCVDVTSTVEVDGLNGVPLLVGVTVTSDVITAVEEAVSVGSVFGGGFVEVVVGAVAGACVVEGLELVVEGGLVEGVELVVGGCDEVSESVGGAKEEVTILVIKLEVESESDVLELGGGAEAVVEGSLLSLEEEPGAEEAEEPTAVLVTVLVTFDMVNCLNSSLPRCLYIAMSVMLNLMMEEVQGAT